MYYILALNNPRVKLEYSSIHNSIKKNKILGNRCEKRLTENYKTLLRVIKEDLNK